MGVLYTLPWTGTIATADGNVDLWEIVPASNKPVRIRGLRLGQTSELGDAAEESLALAIIKLAATITSGNGTAFTSLQAPRPVNDALWGVVTPGFSAEYYGANVGTSTTDIGVLEYLTWNIRQSPTEFWWPDDIFAPQARASTGLVVRLLSAVTDAITFYGTLWVEEL